MKEWPGRVRSGLTRLYRRAGRRPAGPQVRLVASAAPPRLTIVDDVFPLPISDWRLNEFRAYLYELPGTTIVTGVPSPAAGHGNRDYARDRAAFLEANPDIDPASLVPLSENRLVPTSLVYCLFVHNLRRVFPIVSTLNLPLIFALLPGGGFSLYDQDTDDFLRRVFAYPHFRHVFVNMPSLHAYVTQRLGLSSDRVTFSYAGSIHSGPTEVLASDRYRTDHLNVCFVAVRYMPGGLNKGFDVFCRLAARMKGVSGINFFVIGNFSPEDAPDECPAIQFLGTQRPGDLPAVLATMHVFVAPVRPHVLYRGNFDGFPTGAAIHAALAGCALVVSDPMDDAETLGLIDGQDLFLTSDRPSEIEEKITLLHRDRTRLEDMARRCREKLRQLCNDAESLKKRVDVLRRELGASR